MRFGEHATCVSDEADESHPYRPPKPTCNERNHQSRIAVLIVWVLQPVLADPLALFTTTMLLIGGDAYRDKTRRADRI